MLSSLQATERVFPLGGTCPSDGKISISPVKFLWLAFHGMIGFVGVLFFPQLDALLMFLVLTAITICAGHSVGMHRLLIHRSFETPRLLEYLLVWLGVLVGMAGPFGMIRTHDLRDWHQRQTICPPHPSHDAHFWKDAWWQLCCVYKLKTPPKIIIETKIKNDLFYRVLERTWMAQQIPLAILLYILGGWAWVLWGVSLRIFVSLVGHWIVGHIAHRRGEQDWKIEGLPVQGYNLSGLGWITFGENWHGNHHAFPHSAKLGIKDEQSDPGFLLIEFLCKLKLVWNIKLPDSEPKRSGLLMVPQTSDDEN